MPTAPTTPPTITALPDAPQRTQPPAEFVTKADAHVAALTPMVTEENTLAAWQNSTAQEVYDNAVDTNTSAGNASTSEGNASASAVLAENWAHEDEDVPVSGGEFSSKHYSLKSKDWANESEDVPVAAGEFSSRHYSLKSEAFKDGAEAAAAAAAAAAGLPSLVGNAGKSLLVSAGESSVEWGSVVFSEYDEFTVSGTWNKDPAASFIYVEALGGGGGGGNNTAAAISAGGSGGESIHKLFRAQDLGSSETVVIGAGGSGATSGLTGFGAIGGSTTFGIAVSALGGYGGGSTGLWASPAGAKSTAVNNDFQMSFETLSFPGSGYGGYGLFEGGDSAFGGGGGGGSNNKAGGESQYAGNGGAGNSAASVKAADGSSPAGGGGGSHSDGGGGDGADGRVRVWQW